MVMAIRHYKQKALFFTVSWREEDQVSNVKLFDQAKKVLMMLGSYAFAPGKFMKKELRDTIRDSYSAQVIAENKASEDENEK